MGKKILKIKKYNTKNNYIYIFSNITSKSNHQLLKQFLFKYINIIQFHTTSNFINI